jgi:hypothetical protein
MIFCIWRATLSLRDNPPSLWWITIPVILGILFGITIFISKEQTPIPPDDNNPHSS